MFHNIGSFIKDLAKTIFFADAVIALIIGIYLINCDEDLAFLGWMIILIGILAALVSTCLLYGFGQLVENSDIMVAEQKRKNEKYQQAIHERNIKKQKQSYEKAKEAVEDPAVDEDEFIDIICPNCDHKLSYIKEQFQNDGNLTCPICETPIRLSK